MEDFPSNMNDRVEILTKIMGSGSLHQIDGLGGGISTTSKAAIIGRSTDPKCDIDYLFAQVGINDKKVDFSPNCGNILAGVAPFAIEVGYIKPVHPTTIVKIRNINTGKIIVAEVETPYGQLNYEGNVYTNGIPEPSAAIKLTFLDVAGSKTGALFPTRNTTDTIHNILVTCIDAAMPCVIINAKDLGKTGYESPEELNNDLQFMNKLEQIRQKAGYLMGLGDVSNQVIPKPVIFSPAKLDGDISVRYFVPNACHKSLAVTGSIAIACAYTSPDTVISQSINTTNSTSKITLEHPSGTLQVNIDSQSNDLHKNISITRTARKIMSGTVFIA